MGGFIPLIIIFIIIGLVTSKSNKSKSDAQKKQVRKTFDEYDSLTEQQPQTVHRQNIAPRVAPQVEEISADERLSETHSEKNCGVQHNEFSAKMPEPTEANSIVSELFKTRDDCVKAVIYSEIMNPKFKNI